MQINLCLHLVVAMHTLPHPGSGGFPVLWPDLVFLGPILLHSYKDMSLAIGPADGSPPKFRDHFKSEWGQIQLQGAEAFQRLLETLDRASLRTLLGGLANRNWHRLVTQWSEIRRKYSLIGRDIASKTRTELVVTLAIATLLEKNSHHFNGCPVYTHTA